MSASLQHETSQAHEASDERAGASGAGHGFEAGGVTRRSSPACSPACNTRHRRHTRRQMNELAPVGQGTGSRPVAIHGVHPLHVGIPATRDIAGTRGRQRKKQAPGGSGRRFEACGVTGRPSPACPLPCDTRHRRHARASDERAGASRSKARVRGLLRHPACIPCMKLSLQHETSQARKGVR